MKEWWCLPMATFYKQYTIKKDDTVQSIAFTQLGSTDYWTTLVEQNNLVYPYIVASNEDRMKDPEHLLSYGDRIYLPVANSLNDLDLSNVNAYNQNQIYDVSMGMDLGMDIDAKNGYDESISTLTDDNQDLKTVSGVDNLRQSIALRLLTRRGTLLNHPEYGTNLMDYIGDNITTETLQLIKVEVKRTISTDERVSSVDISESYLNGNKTLIVVKITPIDSNTAFKLFIDRAENGTVRIR